MLPQDLHIHTVYSIGDSAIVNEQTVDLVKNVQHARIVGISDHFDYLTDDETFDRYEKEVRAAGFKLGIEISGHRQVDRAVERSNDYFVYHCFMEEDYRELDRMLETGKPVIIAHPLMMGTNLDKIPRECFIEVNNRYVWRNNWREGFFKFIKHRKFVISSDAHQPHWLNQNVARYVCREMQIRETILFPGLQEEVELPGYRERTGGTGSDPS